MKMRNVTIPELELSRWYAWEDREQYELRNFPGVYVIAITRDNLARQEISLKEVVYAGMTVSQGGLKSRWNQFQRAINGNEGHSGGNTIYADKGAYGTWPEGLYVAAMGIECNVINPSPNDYLKMGWVAFLEYDIFARFADKVGGHPKYNKQ